MTNEFKAYIVIGFIIPMTGLLALILFVPTLGYSDRLLTRIGEWAQRHWDY